MSGVKTQKGPQRSGPWKVSSFTEAHAGGGDTDNR